MGSRLVRIGLAAALVAGLALSGSLPVAFSDDGSPVMGVDPIFVSVSTTGDHSLGLDDQGRVWGWGMGGSGQLGNDTNANQSSPILVDDSSLGDGVTFTSVVTGDYHSLAVDSLGRLWAWGRNGSGELGVGDTTGRSRPVLVDGDGFLGDELQVALVAAGYSHSLAVDSSGRLWAWGYNGSGQLGDGTTSARSRPVLVDDDGFLGDGLQVALIAGGGSHSLAVDSSGMLWAWGGNGSAQLGNGESGSYKNQLHPVLVDGNAAGSLGDGSVQVKAIAAGFSHSLAVDSSGRLWAWGSNASGQLGDGTGSTASRPVLVDDNSDSTDGFLGDGLQVASVTAGYSHSLAVDANGRVWAWGWNNAGQLGDGSAVDRKRPVLVIDDSAGVFSGVRIVSIAGGWEHSLAVDELGRVWAWGYDDYGELGNGADAASNVPVNVQVGAYTDTVSLVMVSSGACGGTLQAVLSEVGFPLTNVTYSWLATSDPYGVSYPDGWDVVQSGASDTYVLKAADVGKHVVVRVTGRAATPTWNQQQTLDTITLPLVGGVDVFYPNNLLLLPPQIIGSIGQAAYQFGTMFPLRPIEDFPPEYLNDPEFLEWYAGCVERYPLFIEWLGTPESGFFESFAGVVVPVPVVMDELVVSGMVSTAGVGVAGVPVEVRKTGTDTVLGAMDTTASGGFSFGCAVWDAAGVDVVVTNTAAPAGGVVSASSRQFDTSDSALQVAAGHGSALFSVAMDAGLGLVFGLVAPVEVGFDTRSGVEDPVTQLVFPGEKVVKPQVLRAGYYLSSWWTTSNYLPDTKWNFTDTVSESLTLFAKWLENNIDTDGDGDPDVNIDLDGDDKPDINIDLDGDNKPDVNIDVDGDGIPDINIDTDGDLIPDINIDTDGDLIPDVNVLYRVLGDGGFGVFTGSGVRSVSVDAPYSKFVKLLLGDDTVTASNYTVVEGSTVITLQESYLKTFTNGTYWFTAIFTNGESERIELIVDVPEVHVPTGGRTVTTTTSLLLTVTSFGVLCILAGYKRRLQQTH